MLCFFVWVRIGKKRELYLLFKKEEWITQQQQKLMLLFDIKQGKIAFLCVDAIYILVQQDDGCGFLSFVVL